MSVAKILKKEFRKSSHVRHARVTAYSNNEAGRKRQFLLLNGNNIQPLFHWVNTIKYYFQLLAGTFKPLNWYISQSREMPTRAVFCCCQLTMYIGLPTSYCCSIMVLPVGIFVSTKGHDGIGLVQVRRAYMESRLSSLMNVPI